MCHFKKIYQIKSNSVGLILTIVNFSHTRKASASCNWVRGDWDQPIVNNQERSDISENLLESIRKEMRRWIFMRKRKLKRETGFYIFLHPNDNR